ncbi:MAG TPA: hypothetical protein VFX03_11800 [Thermomicrobiales bacterium]|nr:hypothetical protein [Thermomicrobiales bacterium]
MLEPRGGIAGFIDLVQREMGHEAVGGGAVPMLFARLEKDAIAGADDRDRPDAPLGAADSSVTEIVWPLGCACQAVRAPGVKWTLLADRRDAPDGAAT